MAGVERRAGVTETRRPREGRHGEGGVFRPSSRAASGHGARARHARMRRHCPHPQAFDAGAKDVWRRKFSHQREFCVRKVEEIGAYTVRETRTLEDADKLTFAHADTRRRGDAARHADMRRRVDADISARGDTETRSRGRADHTCARGYADTRLRETRGRGH